MAHGAGPGESRGEWRLHLYLVLGLALCAAAFWFELHRALGGNALSWAYVFEWPLLGGFAVYAWWRFRHPERARTRPEPTLDPAFDGMLAAWRDHQADLTREQGEQAAEGTESC